MKKTIDIEYIFEEEENVDLDLIEKDLELKSNVVIKKNNIDISVSETSFNVFSTAPQHKYTLLMCIDIDDISIDAILQIINAFVNKGISYGI